MLKTLQIKNFALIDSVEIDFCSGLNIITGETGAGKSIIIDALMVLLGERASIEYIRHGESKSVIEGTFEIPEKHVLLKMLSEEGCEIDNNELIIRREINIKGTSRSFLNDSPIQASLLKKVGDMLVDFHGQYDHQLLLKKESHISLLDSIADVTEIKEKYSFEYDRLRLLISDYNSLVKTEKEIKSKVNSNRLELYDIEKINPLPDEESSLETELRIIENSELLFNSTTELYSILYDSETSVHDSLNLSRKILEQLAEIDSEFNVYVQEMNTAIITIDEIAKFSKDYSSRTQFDPERVAQIRERMQQLRSLRKKYGTFDIVFERIEQLKKELSLVENFEEAILSIEKEINRQKIELGKVSELLSQKRTLTAKKFERSIADTLQNLGIPYPIFRVVFQKEEVQKLQTELFSISNMSASIDSVEYKAFTDGIDLIEFFISTNKGEIPLPLAEIASGGEISRVMLAIKSIVAETGDFPIMVFDEIDIGISGRIAQKVGLTMKELAKHHQIISITHLPQISALGERNIQVEKLESKSRTNVQARVLNYNDKLQEIARLLSGEEITDAALKSAIELINAN